MPSMNWTAENDRLFFLKVIEIHGISPNYQKIQEAWPQDAPVRPTAKALSERFAKLKKLAANPGLIKPAPATPSARVGKGFSTPSSSAKKRKTKKANTDSDADDHLTPSEDETPTTKTRKTATARGPRSGGRSVGTMLCNSFDDGVNRLDAGSPSGIRVKQEPVADPFRNGEFFQGFNRAQQLRQEHGGGLNPGYASFGDASGYDASFDSAGFMDGNNDDIMSFNNFVGNGIASGSGIDLNNGMGMGMGMGIPMNSHQGFNGHNIHFNNGNGVGVLAQEQIINNTSRLQLSSPQQARNGLAPSARQSVAPSEISLTNSDIRPRSSRQASQQASNNMTTWLEHEKEIDHANGEKSSEEDSQASEFQGSEDDYV